MELFTNIERIKERSTGHSNIFEPSILPVFITKLHAKCGSAYSWRATNKDTT